MALIDTGCEVQGYKSDITRSYVFGEPTPRQRTIWELENRRKRPLSGRHVSEWPARKLIEQRGVSPGPLWFTRPAHSCDAPFGVTEP